MNASQTSQERESWTFGPYTLDAEGHLRLGPSTIHLPPLQRRLLVALVRQKGQVLSRDQLLQEVWDHNNVSEVSISRTVHGLRRVLGEGPLGQGVIRTIYGGGYRLEAPIHPEGPSDIASDSAKDSGSRFPTAQTLSAYVEGLVWMRQRDPRQLQRAERHLHRCVEMAPDFTPALVQLAAARLARYRWGLLPAESVEPGLEQLLKRAEASGQMRADVMALRVEVLSLLHWQPDLAEARFGNWLPEQLQGSGSLHSWVRHLLATGRAPAVIPLLEPHLQAENPDGWLLAAMAWWWQGESRQAISCLQTQLNSGDLLASRLLLAMVLADTGHPAEALRELDGAAIAVDPENGLQAMVVLVLALCGKKTQAAARLQAGLAHGKQQLTMTTLWGLAALAIGEGELGSGLLEQAVATRCGLAPFVQHMPVLRHLEENPALDRFQEGMAKRFRCTF